MSPTINALMHQAVDLAAAARGWQQMVNEKPEAIAVKDDIELHTMHEYYLMKSQECLTKCIGVLVELEQLWQRLEDDGHNHNLPPMDPLD